MRLSCLFLFSRESVDDMGEKRGFFRFLMSGSNIDDDIYGMLENTKVGWKKN